MSKRSADVLRDMITFNLNAIKESSDPAKEIAELAAKAVGEVPRVLETDRLIYRTIVFCFVFVVVAGTTSYIITTAFSGWKIEMPPELNSIISSSAGYLAAVLRGEGKG
jgi:hypothetical protein